MATARNVPNLAAVSEDVFRLSEQMSIIMRVEIGAALRAAPAIDPTVAASALLHAHSMQIARILAISPATDAEIDELLTVQQAEMRAAIAAGRAEP